MCVACVVLDPFCHVQIDGNTSKPSSSCQTLPQICPFFERGGAGEGKRTRGDVTHYLKRSRSRRRSWKRRRCWCWRVGRTCLSPAVTHARARAHTCTHTEMPLLEALGAWLTMLGVLDGGGARAHIRSHTILRKSGGDGARAHRGKATPPPRHTYTYTTTPTLSQMHTRGHTLARTPLKPLIWDQNQSFYCTWCCDVPGALRSELSLDVR